MDKDINHILNVTGILKNFSITKKITRSELSEIKKRISNVSTDSQDYSELLKREILRYTDSYVKKNKIPGLIVNNPSVVRNKKYISLYKEAASIARSLKLDKKLSDKELIFFILSIVSYLQLTRSDFEKFRKELEHYTDFDEINSDEHNDEHNDEYDDEYDDDDDDDDDDSVDDGYL